MKKLILLLIFVLFASCVFAVKPISVTNIQENTGGLQIEYPKNIYFPEGKPIDLHFHLYNGTNYQLNNNTGYCMFHLYNHTGNHILETNLSYSGIEFEVKLTPDLFLDSGMYPYLVYCENNGEYGFLSTEITINKNGKEPQDKIPFIFGIALVSIILLAFAFKLDKEHFILRLLIILVSITNLILIPRVLLFVGNTDITFYKLIMYFYGAFWIYVFVYLIYKVLKHFGIIVSKNKNG